MTTSHVLAAAPSAHAAGPQYSILVAATPDEVRAAQRLRYAVFAEELGARAAHRRARARHRRVRPRTATTSLIREDRSGQIVGTYRMLPPDRAAAAGGSTPRPSSTSARLDATARDHRRDRPLVRASRPPHAAPSSISCGPASPATCTCTGTAGWPGAHRSRWPTAAHSANAVWEVVRERHMSPAADCGSRRTSRTPSGRRPPPSAPTCWPPCRRCCAATCGWAPGSVASRPSTPTSGWPTSSSCSRWTRWTRATSGTSGTCEPNIRQLLGTS